MKKGMKKKAEAKKVSKKTKKEINETKKIRKLSKKHPSLKLRSEKDIAMDFAVKAYKKFDKLAKSIILFGSSNKGTQTSSSDIDIIIVVDDATISWDQQMIAWYREELDKLLRTNPYKKDLHINTVKLTTWWEDLMRGDPVIINIIRYGEAMVDMAGFFEPLKFLLVKGKIRPTPEAIYASLQRAPQHIAKSKAAEINSIEALYWSMVDSAHAALIAANVAPPSPEHVPGDLKETFVNKGTLDKKYVLWFRDLLIIYKKISHNELHDLKGVEIDKWQDRAEEFLGTMTKLIDDIISQ